MTLPDLQKLAQQARNTPPPPVGAAPTEVIPATGVQMFPAQIQGHDAMMFQFGAQGQVFTPIALLMQTEEDLDSYLALTMQMVEAMREQILATEAEPEAEEAPAEVVKCSGCGQRLFGDRAAAGLCTSCEKGQEG